MSDNQNSCRSPKKHRDHICQLRKKGMMQEIDQHAENPIVRCAKCGSEASNRDVLCQPIEL